jgi:polyhydroxyalkanoate synthesis regulator phasin
MVDMLKKSVFATIGIALMTREKAEEIGKKVASEAKLSESEGKQFVDELLKRVDETRHSLEKTVAHYVETALKKVNIVSRKEFEELDTRIRKLENNPDQGTV